VTGNGSAATQHFQLAEPLRLSLEAISAVATFFRIFCYLSAIST